MIGSLVLRYEPLQLIRLVPLGGWTILALG